MKCSGSSGFRDYIELPASPCVWVNTGNAEATRLAQVWAVMRVRLGSQSAFSERVCGSGSYVNFRFDGGPGRFDEGLRPRSAARSFGAAKSTNARTFGATNRLSGYTNCTGTAGGAKGSRICRSRRPLM